MRVMMMARSTTAPATPPMITPVFDDEPLDLAAGGAVGWLPPETAAFCVGPLAGGLVTGWVVAVASSGLVVCDGVGALSAP
jgi:hypothetical protein